MRAVAGVLVLAAVCSGTAHAAVAFDQAAMARWAQVAVVHYEVTGEMVSERVQLPASDADMYGRVTERVTLSFDWDKENRRLVGAPTFKNWPGTVSNLAGLDDGCPAGRLNGPYEFFDIVEVRSGQDGETLELLGKRVIPDLMVAESCGSSLRLYPGTELPQTQTIIPLDPMMLAFAEMAEPGGPFTVSPDGKSISMKALNDPWTWTFTPSPK